MYGRKLESNLTQISVQRLLLGIWDDSTATKWEERKIVGT